MVRAARPRAVAFDVNETLTDLSPLAGVFERFGVGKDALAWWFAALVRDGFALAAAGGAAGFGELALVALDEVATTAGRVLPDGAGDELMGALARVPLHRDVSPALERLRAAGLPAFALTNGSAAFARGILDAAGVTDALVEVVSVDAVGHWKPRPEPYRYAAEVAGVDPAQMALVAVHPWDTHGASAAGLLTGWVNRTGRLYPAVFAPPTVRALDLVGVVDQLLQLPET